jgi:hypothetical protein
VFGEHSRWAAWVGSVDARAPTIPDEEWLLGRTYKSTFGHTAVLLDIRTYQDLLEELEELRDVQRGLDDVAAGRTVSHADVVATLDARLKR